MPFLLLLPLLNLLLLKERRLKVAAVNKYSYFLIFVFDKCASVLFKVIYIYLDITIYLSIALFCCIMINPALSFKFDADCVS